MTSVRSLGAEVGAALHWAERPRLLARLDAMTAPIVAVVAPAGYGKTTLLRQWTALDRRPTVWVDLEVAGGDHVARLDAVAVRVQEHRGAADAAALVLVLDHADCCAHPGLDHRLLAVAGQLPAGSVLAIASRGELGLPVGGLRVRGMLDGIRACDLAMTPAEACEALARRGVCVDDAQLRELASLTEGWAAAVVLAAQALGALGPTDAGWASARDGISAYLREEVVGDLDPQARELLAITSVAEELTGELCDVLGATHGGGERLRGLVRAGAFVTAVDERESVFRLHARLRELFAGELARREPARRVALHLQTSRWFEAAGRDGPAIDQAVDAGAVSRLGRLLWRSAPGHAGHGRVARIDAPLRRLGRSRVASEPRLAMCSALAGALHGDRDVVEQWLDVAQSVMARSPPAPDDLTSALGCLRAWVARDGPDQMAADARRAGETGDRWAPLGAYLHGVALSLGDDAPGDAVEHLTRAARGATLGAPLLHALCLSHLALLNMLDGGWEDGIEQVLRARREVDAAGLDELPIVAIVFAVSALAAAHRGQPGVSVADHAAAEQLLSGLDDMTPWYEAQAQVALARSALRLSDAPDAREHLRRAARAGRGWAPAASLRRWIADGWERSDAFAAGAVAGVSTLTTAELRVLRMLPSHLSLPEIAARLGVSTNTVKTQAHAIYRKLDASSRSAAVVRARAVGLVDE